MSDFFSMVQKLNAISQNEEVSVTPSPETTTKRKEIAETATLLNKFNAISEQRPFVAEAEEAEVDETMQDRFAKFLKAERSAGTEVEEMKSMIDEGTAEYEYADRAFSKIAETINTLEQMVREGGMLERKIAQAGGDPAALADMREALDQAYQAYEMAHQDALGSTPEQQPED
tara:strand:+ start:750 stop:1268 length:519 start_codon:yes stop_codon:yes gene_type:complete